MRKLTLFTLTLTTVLATTASPLLVQANSKKAACETLQKNGCVVVEGTVITNQKELEKVLSELEQELKNGNWKDCFPNIFLPDTEMPDNGEVEEDKGEVELPDAEENESSAFAKQVVKLVNEERVKAGLSELEIDTQVEAAALIRAKEIKQSFSHTRPDGSQFSTALREQGVSYKGSGENIAWGQKTPEEVMQGWMNSEGHRANILNSKFTKIGVGYYQDEAGRNYWTQLFIY